MTCIDYIRANADQLIRPLRTIDQETVYQALILCRGNIKLTAKRLGINRTTLQSRLAKWKKDAGQ